MHVLMMLIILDRYLSSFRTTLRYLQKIQSEPEVDKLLYLLITFLNSSLEKLGYSFKGFEGILSNNYMFTC